MRKSKYLKRTSILQKRCRAIRRHNHTAQSRHDELLNGREVLHHTRRTIQQINRLQQIDLLRRLRICDDLVVLRVEVLGLVRLSVHDELGGRTTFARHDRQSLQHRRTADTLRLEVLVREVRLRLHEHACVLLRRSCSSDVQHGGDRLRITLAFLVHLLFGDRRFWW